MGRAVLLLCFLTAPTHPHLVPHSIFSRNTLFMQRSGGGYGSAPRACSNIAGRKDHIVPLRCGDTRDDRDGQHGLGVATCQSRL